MTDLRDMQLLAALARQKHFARAADECGISQPAFSARIRNLEKTLGAPIVKRGNRFIGFTPEGEIVLKWAHLLLANADSLRQEIEEAKSGLSGQLKLGVVPTALAFVATLPPKLRALHPDLSVHIISASSAQIARGLEDFSLDAGVTYLDEDLPVSFNPMPLYEERYLLVAPKRLAPKTSGNITWAEAAELPLCLLTSDMRNRQILDEIFKYVDADPKPVMETNAFTAALAQVSNGISATIAPERLVESFPIAGDAVRLSLVKPVVSKPIGLITADREPVPPSVKALLTALELPSR